MEEQAVQKLLHILKEDIQEAVGVILLKNNQQDLQIQEAVVLVVLVLVQDILVEVVLCYYILNHMSYMLMVIVLQLAQ